MEHETDRSLWSRVIRPGWRSRAVFLIRLAVGLIFFTQGVLKYIDPNMGVNRFAKIGFSHPYFTAHFVGAFEMVCGFLVLIGLVTRIAAIPLLIVICTAIATTKIPELSQAQPRILVHGQRCTHGFLHVDVLAVPDGRGCGLLVTWTHALEAQLQPKKRIDNGSSGSRPRLLPPERLRAECH